MIQASSTVSHANNHFSVEHDGATIIMSITAGRYFAFDENGLKIWDGLKTPIRLDALAGRLAAEYNAPIETVTQVMLQFVDKLVDAQLVVVSE